jgi:hypothetical protein
MDAEHLAYFKAAMEGEAKVGWNIWFATHQQALSRQLSRPAFLRLKFKKLDEAERLLAAAGIVPRSTVGKRYECYCALLVGDAMDENGRPNLAFWRSRYDGALGKLADGDRQAGTALLHRCCERASSMGLEAMHDLLTDLCFDGEMELTLGNAEVGRAMLGIVVQAGKSHELGEPLAHIARELLHSHR